MDFQYVKLEIFIPESRLRALQRALCDVDAGHIGNYDCALSYSRVTSTWRPLEGAHPYKGESGKVSEEEELKVEVTVDRDRVGRTIEAIREVHPYEEPVINVIPMLLDYPLTGKA